MGFCQQFNALMVKNFTLKKRKYMTSIFEIVLPVFSLIVLVGIRQAVNIKNNDPDLQLGSRRYLAATLGPSSFTEYDFDNSQQQDNIVFANTIRGLIYKVIRRGHVLAISPNAYPFCDPNEDSTGDSFSAFLARYIQDTAARNNLTIREPGAGSCSGSWYLRGFSGSSDMDAYATSSNYPESGYLEAGVNFDGFDPQTGMKYTIRMNKTGGADFSFPKQIPNSFESQTDDLSTGFDDHYWNMLLNWGFVPWQNFIESWAIGRVTGNQTQAQLDNAVNFIPFPTPQYREDEFDGYVSSLLPILFTLTFIWPVTRLVKQFVEEKELRIKEGLKTMGMSTSAHFLSWFVTYILVFLVMCLLILLVTHFGRVYTYSNLFIIFLYFYIFCLCVFAFCWLVASFFSKATVAATVSSILFLGAFLGSFGLNEETTAGGKVLACLSAPICFGLGAQQISLFESAQQGITFQTIGTMENNFTFATCLGMLIFDFVLYIVLAVYAERVLPTEWGVSLPPWFCCLPSFWCPRPPSEDAQPREFDDRYEITENIEAQVGVAVRNLEKRFGTQSAEEAAVRGINLDMYQGQIFALLGHNGAGKTTTINMITGMLPPTSGDAVIDGYNIIFDMQQIRQNLGVCPQHNILYDLLTVTEHLYLFARMKGVPRQEIPVTVQRLIEEVGLTEKVNTYSSNLSGGMKRKLSVAIALIGGSSTVILDEPTSGMDPYSRRSTWEMLKMAKNGRVLVLTTHFMDEADQLGDRIAIMHKGLIKCCGSSLFLKTRYGVGYTLTIDKEGSTENDAKMIKVCVEKYVPKCKVLSDVAGEISFQLPFSDSGKFPEIFDELDENKEKWGVNSYGVSVTTLEEVFLKVGHEADEEVAPVELKRRLSERMRRGGRARNQQEMEQGESKVVVAQDSTIDDAKEAKREEEAAAGLLGSSGGGGNDLGKPLLHDDNLHKASAVDTIQESEFARTLNHFFALLAKRWHNAKRDRKVWMWQILYPFLWLLGGIGLLKFASSLAGKPISISIDVYNTPNYIPTTLQSLPLLDSVSNPSHANFVNATTPSGTAIQDRSCTYTTSPPDNLEGMSRYLLCTWREFEQSKYGAYLLDERVDISEYSGSNNSIFVNTTATYGTAAYLNLLNEARARRNISSSFSSPSSSTQFALDLNVQAWPLTRQQQTLNQGLVSIVVAIAFAFIPASIAGFVVMERQTKSKHLQIISGVSVIGYWCANLVWDFLNFLPPSLISLAVFKIFSIDSLTGEAAGVLFMVSLLYAFAVITFTYCVSFMFKNPSSAQSIMLMVYIFTGCILLIASIIMGIIPSTVDVNDKMKYVYRLVPSFSFGESVINLMTRDSIIVWGEKKTPTDWEIVGRPCVYLVCEFIAYFASLLIIEKVLATPRLYGFFYRPIEVTDEAFEDDEDVIAEMKRLKNGTKLTPNSNEDTVVLKGLRKVYPGQDHPKVAVKNLWFGVPRGQCFGFLGINGAGKSSTLKMLTGDVLPSSGTADLAGLDVLDNQLEVRKLIGYCPQFDALLPNMTARETLRMFARFKGVSSDTIEEYVEALCKQLSLDINGWLDKPCGGYSGGNKRKLSVGIALVGNPPIVFLDEPSTGMDPGSRRFMWNLISSTMADRSVILTTHSMEECEALCSRLGIMVGGRLRCIGSSQRIKSRYGSGYQLDVKVANGQAHNFKLWLRSKIKETTLLEDQGDNMKFRINPQETKFTLSKVFRMIEDNRNKLGIVGYSVSETTLEQIFIHFAKQQDEEKGPVAGFTGKVAAKGESKDDDHLLQQPGLMARRNGSINDEDEEKEL
mmetsp:Transcript_7608/g.12112  ORF Transcript_7608/g.12112 Transcript_7608/m.12112 type:complete len:1794 (-) Transcript_7608:303-5684(-)